MAQASQLTSQQLRMWAHAAEYFTLQRPTNGSNHGSTATTTAKRQAAMRAALQILNNHTSTAIAVLQQGQTDAGKSENNGVLGRQIDVIKRIMPDSAAPTTAVPMDIDAAGFTAVAEQPVSPFQRQAIVAILLKLEALAPEIAADGDAEVATERPGGGSGATESKTSEDESHTSSDTSANAGDGGRTGSTTTAGSASTATSASAATEQSTLTTALIQLIALGAKEGEQSFEAERETLQAIQAILSTVKETAPRVAYLDGIQTNIRQELSQMQKVEKRHQREMATERAAVFQFFNTPVGRAVEARLNKQDAQIAALTARLAAFEATAQHTGGNTSAVASAMGAPGSSSENNGTGAAAGAGGHDGATRLEG